MTRSHAERLAALPLGTVLQGDVLERLRELPDACVQAVVTDPPYGLHFMGQHWDSFSAGKGRRALDGPGRPGSMNAGAYDSRRNAEYGRFIQAVGRELFRALKPGGMCLMFGAPRRHHWQGVALELAGFEVWDTLCWLFGQGFPKSLNIGKAIDRAAGAKREVVGRRVWADGSSQEGFNVTAPATPEAAAWEGWGTALKPGWEPIICARKPVERGLSIAANVLKHGVGGIHVRACGIQVDGERPARGDWKARPAETASSYDVGSGFAVGTTTTDRWPADVLHDGGDEVLEAFAAFGPDGGTSKKSRAEIEALTEAAERGDFDDGETEEGRARAVAAMVSAAAKGMLDGPDVSSAARFFYCAKAGRGEREAGLEGLPMKRGGMVSETSGQHITRRDGGEPGQVHNHHPTVKPLALMRWLVRLVTPDGRNGRPRGIVLDPFLGSGTTACAAEIEGVDWIGIEREPDFVRIAEARVAHWRAQAPAIRAAEAAEAAEKAGGPPAEIALAEAAGQLNIPTEEES
jgi:site-specific DNA-methyltransferase (adenine-specific)